MRPVLATVIRLRSPEIHPALRGFAAECRGVLARPIAYIGALVLIAIAGVHVWDQFSSGIVNEAPAKPDWSLTSRSSQAFTVSATELHGKTGTYQVFRHAYGGRKDIIRWSAAGENPVAELEIYRPGAELGEARSATAEIAARIDPNGTRELEAAGVIDSKFGTVALLGFASEEAVHARPCTGFMKRLDPSDLRLSGWSCDGETAAARRISIGCILNGLTLLTAGNDPKLAELFARAELKRRNCAPANATANWVSDAPNPPLRGSF